MDCECNLSAKIGNFREAAAIAESHNASALTYANPNRHSKALT
jgi:hypothetical protein